MQTACQQISELLISFQYSPTSSGYNSLEHLPQFLRNPLRNVVISLARLPLVNSYARTPPYACKLGWTPSPREGSVEMPPLPMEYLKEKDVLKEFVIRTNAIGWTSRQQFEETWAGLLGVFTAPVIPEEIAPEVGVTKWFCQRSNYPHSHGQCIPLIISNNLIYTDYLHKAGQVRSCFLFPILALFM